MSWSILSYILRTILLCTKGCLNLGGCCVQPIPMLHSCVSQDFMDHYSLIKLKLTIIQCLVVNAYELRHWLSLWVLPTITGPIPPERLRDFINIVLWIFPKQIIIHINHLNHSLRYEHTRIHLAHHKITIWQIIP